MALDIPIDESTVVDRTTTIKLGVQALDLPEGEAISNDAISSTCCVIENPATGEQAVMVTMVTDHAGMRLGAHVVFNPEQARAFANGILAGADQVEQANAGRAN